MLLALIYIAISLVAFLILWLAWSAFCSCFEKHEPMGPGMFLAVITVVVYFFYLLVNANPLGIVLS